MSLKTWLSISFHMINLDKNKDSRIELFFKNVFLKPYFLFYGLPGPYLKQVTRGLKQLIHNVGKDI